MKKRILASILTLTVLVSTMVFGTLSASAAEKVNIEEGVYTIFSKLNSNMVLDIAGGSTASGGNLQLYQYNGTPSQLFWIQKSGSYYTITPMCSGMPLDVQGGTMSSGTNVQQYYSKTQTLRNGGSIMPATVIITLDAATSHLMQKAENQQTEQTFRSTNQIARHHRHGSFRK